MVFICNSYLYIDLTDAHQTLQVSSGLRAFILRVFFCLQHSCPGIYMTILLSLTFYVFIQSPPSQWRVPWPPYIKMQTATKMDFSNVPKLHYFSPLNLSLSHEQVWYLFYMYLFPLDWQVLFFFFSFLICVFFYWNILAHIFKPRSIYLA